VSRTLVFAIDSQFSHLFQFTTVDRLWFILFRYNRCDVMALGKFSVNLCGWPREQGREFVIHLSNLISCLVTKVIITKLYQRQMFRQSTK